MRINKWLAIILLLCFCKDVSGQSLNALVTGDWLEVYKKTKQYYLPLNIRLNEDGTAAYPDRYPENSYNLTYVVTPDSNLLLSNHTRYKIVSINTKLIQLRTIGVKKPKLITLKRAVPVR